MQKCATVWLQIRIDDHRIQSEYKFKSELQNPEGKKSLLGITSASETEHDTKDNVTTKTQSTSNTAHMNINT